MNNLKKLREERHLTQLALGMEIAVQQETISAYENGKAMPTADTLLKLVEYFSCSADYLLDLTDIKSPADKLVLENLSAEEAQLVADYRALGREARGRLLGYLDCLQKR